MNKDNQLSNYLKRFVDVSDEEASVFCSYFKESKIKKGQFIVQPEFTARYKNYVLKGAFRAYVIDQKGDDHTISFAIDDWWITDVNSYVYQQPATMFVVALEDSVVMQLESSKEAELKRMDHKYETFFRIMAERSMAFLQRRIVSSLVHSAEERYDHMLATYPLVVERVPQYALASYLHMTTQFLSRIRKKKIGK